MNKKIISLLVGLSMMAASVVPAFASEISQGEEINIATEEIKLEAGEEDISDFQSEDVIIVEDKEAELSDGAYDASVMRYQTNADWVTSYDEACSYIDDKVAEGEQWICFWINREERIQEIKMYAQIMMASEYGSPCASMSYTGLCQWTSPYPRGTCIQCYTLDWFDDNVCNVPQTVSLEEVSDGIKVTWEPVSKVNELYLHIGNTLISVDTTATEFVYKKGKENQSYNISLYAENNYTYVESDYATIKCTHNGSEYECSHIYDKPTFDWSSDYLSCEASAKCKICNQTKTVDCQISTTKYQKADFGTNGETTYRAYTNEIGIGSYYDLKTVKFPKLKSVTIGSKKYTYKGKKIIPSVVVKDINGDVVPEGYYEVHCLNNNAPGKAQYSVVFSGPYCGSYEGYYDIVLDKPIINKLTVKKNTITVALAKTPGAKSYVIEYSDNKNFKNSKKITSKKTTVKLTKLKTNRKYYIRVKAVRNSKYSSNSKVKSIKTKK